jgi:aspartyl-tRNA(Asn)/glutamyl-tRNA(Gln) amidotransferase subunit A
LSDILTVPASLAGIPGISVPCGFAEAPRAADAHGKKLPVGMQLIGPHRGDARVLRVARAFEAATDHAKARPHLDVKPASAKGARA